MELTNKIKCCFCNHQEVCIYYKNLHIYSKNDDLMGLLLLELSKDCKYFNQIGK